MAGRCTEEGEADGVLSLGMGRKRSARESARYFLNPQSLAAIISNRHRIAREITLEKSWERTSAERLWEAPGPRESKGDKKREATEKGRRTASGTGSDSGCDGARTSAEPDDPV